MSESLQTVPLGYAIEDENTGLNTYEEFTVAGIPGNAGLSVEELSLSDNAPLGSKCTDNTSLQGFSYRKKSAGAGESTWVREATIDDLLAQTSSDSWRDPADLKDDTAYASLVAAETAVNTGTIDGVAVLEGNRILFTGITGSNKNVYIVTGTPGAGATLVEDTNLATNNDVLIVDAGTSAGIEFHYNDTTGTWVTSSGTPSNEDGFQNTYTGKPATGSQTTSYTSQTSITNGDNLTVAIGKLDATTDTNTTNIATLTASQAALQTEVDAIETGLGSVIDASGAYVPHTTTNYIDANADLTEDLTDLDAQIKVNADAIASFGGSTVTTGVTAITTVDSVLVDSVKLVEWLVHVQQGNKVKTFEIQATHDGTVGADAATSRYTKSSKLKINGNISGLKVRVNISGAGPTQTMILTVQANSAVDVSTTRQQVL